MKGWKNNLQSRPPWWRRIPRKVARHGTLLRDMVAFHVVHAGQRVLHVVWVIWLRSKRLWRSRHFLASLPSLAAGTALAALVIAGMFLSTESLKNNYVRAGDMALRDGKFADARTCYRRALSLGAIRKEVSFHLALCQIKLGQQVAAAALLRPLTETGLDEYGPAHLVRARQLMSVKAPSPAALAEAREQLQRALALQPTSGEAHLLLGRLEVSAGRLREAEPHLLAAAATGGKPSVHLLLSTVYQAKGDARRSAEHARAARDEFGKQLEAEPNKEEALLGCAQASLQLQEFAVAAGLLRKELGLRDQPAVRRFLADVDAAWIKSLTGQSPSDLELRLQLLEEGLSCNPGHSGLLQLLLAETHRQGAEGNRPRQVLERLLADGPPSPMAHVILGLDAWQQGRFDQARTHLEQAYRLAPDAAIVGNNLAWLLVSGPRPDLPRALGLADAVVARYPDQPNFRDTRGQILVKLGRYKEALADLELAQGHLQGNRNLHLALATTYEKLGMPELAARHREKSEQLTKKPAEKQDKPEN